MGMPPQGMMGMMSGQPMAPSMQQRGVPVMRTASFEQRTNQAFSSLGTFTK